MLMQKYFSSLEGRLQSCINCSGPEFESWDDKISVFLLYYCIQYDLIGHAEIVYQN